MSNRSDRGFFGVIAHPVNTTMEPILQFQGQYRWLSNFHICFVPYEGISYPSAENAYQASKCLEESQRQQFTHLLPGRAKRVGQAILLRPHWDEIRLQVMDEIVIAKFRHNPDLRKLLLETGDAHLEEGNWWGDTFWGVCNGSGLNHLGQILMRVRGEILKENVNDEHESERA